MEFQLIAEIYAKGPMMLNADISQQNSLLAALPTHNFDYLCPHLEMVPLSCGDVIYESGDILRQVYFPTTCIISKDYISVDGSSTELAMIGNEGMIGVALLMGGETMPNRAIVVKQGYAYRLSSALFKQECNRIGGHRSGALRLILLRYTQALMTHIIQTAVCNRHHSVDQQLCRWLLLCLDRLNGDDIYATQELIANMLGVRREGVTEAAGKLHRAGLIHSCRGHITVLDRSGLEARVCECYQVVKSEFDRLLPDFDNPHPTATIVRTGSVEHIRHHRL